MQGASEGDLPRAGGGGGGGRGRRRGAAAPPAGLEGRQRGARAALGAPAAGTARLLPAALLAGARHVSTRLARGPCLGRGAGRAGAPLAAPRCAPDLQSPPSVAVLFGATRVGGRPRPGSRLSWSCSVEGLRGRPKAWLGSLSRLRRTDQPRGWKQRAPDTLSSKQTPALLQPRMRAQPPVGWGPRGKCSPGSPNCPREVREGDGVLRPRRSAWSLPANLSLPTLPAVGTRERTVCGIECVGRRSARTPFFPTVHSQSGLTWSRSPAGLPGESERGAPREPP